MYFPISILLVRFVADCVGGVQIPVTRSIAKGTLFSVPFAMEQIMGARNRFKPQGYFPIYILSARFVADCVGGVQIPVTRSIARVPSRHPFSFFTNSHAHSPHFDIQ
jgi:hypothetical protein